MSVPSTRHATRVLALTVLAAVPVWRGYLAPSILEDCANPEQFYEADGIDPQTTRETAWSRQGYWSREGVSGKIEPNGRREAPLVFSIDRGWGLPGRLLNPTRSFHLEPDQHELRQVQVGSVQLPVHVSRQTVAHGTRFAAYFYIYDHHPVNGVFWTRLRTGLREFSEGARPITLLEVVGGTGKLYQAATERRALEWLTAAWEHYQSACAP